MKILQINKMTQNENITPIIIEKLNSVKAAKNVELFFEKGEYHFYKEGGLEQFVAVSNNRSCVRKIIFPIIEFDSITINGNGSVFVFHDITTPFYVYKSKNIIIKNIIFDRAYSPVINMVVEDKSDKGFKLKIDKSQAPYYVENGNLIFEREWGELSTADKRLDLLLKKHHNVQFLFAGDSTASTENLPACYMLTDATEITDGVYFTYRKNTQTGCIFDEGAEIYCLADSSMRESDVVVLSDSENIKIENITIRRGLSMGIIGQLCNNIEISGLRTDSDFYKEISTLTADCMHFVNCSGKIDIHNCDVKCISDDVINIHGVYTSVKEIDNSGLRVELKHRSQKYFNPYKTGDLLHIINPATNEVVSEFVVQKSEIVSDCGSIIEILGEFFKSSSVIKEGFLVENPKRMPDVNIFNNNFDKFPCMRVSGAGKIVINDNNLSNCACALQALDLSEYWMESGRISNLIFKNNRISNCVGESVIRVGIAGVNDCNAPKIHCRIEISDNAFNGINNKAVIAAGVKELIIENNIFDTEKNDIILIDGEISSKEVCRK